MGNSMAAANNHNASSSNLVRDGLKDVQDAKGDSTEDVRVVRKRLKRGMGDGRVRGVFS